MRRWLLLAVLGAVLVPGAFVGAQLMQVADESGCPSHLVPSPGPIRLRVFTENDAQARALDAQGMMRYLSDRFGRVVQVTGVELADSTGFRVAAAERPLGGEVLAFLAYRASFPNVPTSSGMVDALGFATPGSACAYVSFLPGEPTLCVVRGLPTMLQPSFAYLAHEMGHLLGLTHAPTGLMGHGAFELCSSDTFTDAQRAAIAAWGSA